MSERDHAMDEMFRSQETRLNRTAVVKILTQGA